MDLNGVKVHIGIPFYGGVPAPEMLTISLINTTIALGEAGARFNFFPAPGNCYLEQARCYIADDFLRHSGTHLFMIDADMSWEAADFLRVLEHATVMDCVCGVYRHKCPNESYPVNFAPEAELNEHDCLPATGMGLGFCCVQRHVIETLAAKAPLLKALDRPDGYRRVFRCDIYDDSYRGEDVAFFADLLENGFQSYVDMTVVLDHWGRANYRGSFCNLWRDYKAIQLKGDAKQTPEVDPAKTSVWSRRPVLT